MKNNALKTKSVVFGPTIIISFFILTNIILFLFWIVEDVSDFEDDSLFLQSKYIGTLLEKDSIFTTSQPIKLALNYCKDYSDVINNKNLIFTLWKNDSLVFSSSENFSVEKYSFISRSKNYAWYYYNADFLHRSTYLITYSFKKHKTIAWISLVLLIISVFASRKWILRNQHINHSLQLHSQWSRIGRIASGLIHEIRNPLNAIKVNSQLIEEDIIASNIDQKNDLISSVWEIQTEVDHLDSLLVEFVDYAKPKNINFNDTNINLLLEQSISLYKGEFKQKNIKVKTRLEKNMPHLKVDKNLIKRVFYNLIKNAIQAMPEGGSLKITTFKRADRISINFTDTGLGIGKQAEKSIFDEFYSTKDNGTGLGLAIVKQILENHNGSIAFRNNRKQGVTFTVTLNRKRKTLKETT